MLSISLLAMRLSGMWRSINISPLRGVLQPQTQSNQRARTFAAKPRRKISLHIHDYYLLTAVTFPVTEKRVVTTPVLLASA